MKTNDSRSDATVKTDHTARCLLTDLFGRDEIDRQPLSVQGHHQFREGISNDSRPFDDIDRSLDDDLIDHGGQHQWEVSNSKKKAVAGLLSLLDQLAEDDSNREGQKL